jgi:oligopeptide transport system permease protein
MNIEQGNSLWSDAWLRLKKNRMAFLSLWVLISIFAMCFILPATPIADSALKTNLPNSFAPPSKDHWLGTDQLGRDLLSRVLTGGQVSLLVGLIATMISILIGVSYGAISGYKGGKLDTIMMRIVDILYGLPSLIMVILFSIVISTFANAYQDSLKSVFHPALVNLIVNILPLCLTIGLLGWYTMARIVRSQVLSTKKLEYVEAAVSLGLTHKNILFKQILPNQLGPIIVYTTLTIPGFILTEATLSFLGVGVQPPNSSWGILLSDGANFLETKPLLLIIPSMIFATTLLCLNFLGDGLRDALDPKASKD